VLLIRTTITLPRSLVRVGDVHGLDWEKQGLPSLHRSALCEPSRGSPPRDQSASSPTHRFASISFRFSRNALRGVDLGPPKSLMIAAKSRAQGRLSNPVDVRAAYAYLSNLGKHGHLELSSEATKIDSNGSL
jgi:hypothetical protein